MSNTKQAIQNGVISSTNPERLLSLNQVRIKLHVRREAVHELIKKGTLKIVIAGRRKKIQEKDLQNISGFVDSGNLGNGHNKENNSGATLRKDIKQLIESAGR